MVFRPRLVLIIVLLVGGIFATTKLFEQPLLVVRNPDAYQAVFLDNSQVYFGKLKSANREFWSLTDIYYLRTGTVLRQTGTETTPQVDLVKLGGELHAPKDEMIINKARVIFYEEISETGEVMKLIRQNKGK